MVADRQAEKSRIPLCAAPLSEYWLKCTLIDASNPEQIKQLIDWLVGRSLDRLFDRLIDETWCFT